MWVLGAVVLATIQVPAAPLSIYRECLPQAKWEGRWEGSHMDLTAWLAEDAELTELEDPLLTFTMEPVGSSLPYDYDVLYLTRNQVEVMRVRNSRGTRNELTVSPGLPSGWTAFNLSSSSSHTQLWHNQQTQLVSLPADMTIDRLTIEGSNITVNCHHDELGWEVRGTKEVVVPLPGHLHRHHLSTYSNTASRPRVTLADTTLQLGWDGANLVDVTHYDQKYQSPLPAAIEHHLYIVCTSFSADILCDILAGEKILKTVNLLKPPAWLTILGKQEDHFFTFYHREAANITRDVKSLSNPGGEDTRGSVMALVAAVVVLALVALALLAVIAYSYYTQKKAGQSTSEETPAEIKEMVALLTSNDSMIDIKSEEIIRVAIIEGDKGRVKALLDKTNKAAAYVEAHIQAKKDIIQIISQRTQEEVETPKNLLVISVLGELQQRIKVVFEAARSGLYKGTGGVKILLQTYGLPGTVRDEDGLSIIHHMVTNMLNDGKTPVWSARDIEDFLKTQQHCINAVDYQGQTVLHILACHPRDTTNISWGNETQTVDEMWCNMAQIFIDHGCNPTLTDHCGLHPYQKAMTKNNAMLSNFLQEKYEAFVSWDFEKGTQKHEQLVSAAREGNIHTMAALLKEGVPVLPMTARADPLLHAIRHSQRDAVLMLLSAGAPLCNQSIEDVTPLEAAHNTLGLPAVFPAIMRKAYCERLEDEMTRVSQENESMKTLRKAMSDYSVQVMDVGSRARWIFSSTEPQRRVAEARTLLTQAAHMGLAFTCQLLGLESMYFHSLPGEESPLKKAISHMQTDTQVVLYRDLKLAPVTCGTVHHDTLTSKYLNNYSVSECQALGNYCSTESNNNVMLTKETLQEVIDLMKICTGEHSRHLLQEPSTQLLFLIAKHGLVALLHTLLSLWTNVNVNQIVDSASRGTMLHVATIFGQINIVEYVLHHGVDPEAVTTGNFTAAHLAAVTGRPKCLQYILAYMAHLGARVDHTCLLGLTAPELMTKYENLCRNCKLPLLSHADALCVKNERGEDARAYKMLQIKGKILNIRLPEDLLNVALESSCERSSTHEFVSTVKEELRNFCKRINDSRFQGKLIPVGSAVEGNEVFNIDHMSFIYEVCGQEASPSWTPLTLSDIVTDDKTRVEVKSHSQMDLFTFDAFKNSFVHIVYDLLKDYKTFLPHMSLAPPFAAVTENGVCLYWLWHNADNIKLIRTSVVPVLPATCSYKNSFGNLPKCASQFVDANQNLCLHIANVHNHWMYRTYLYEDAIFSNLGTNQRKVWLACRMLNQLVKGCWWVPEFSNRWHKQPWHTLTLAVQGLPERALKSLFLRELAEAEEWDSTHHMFKRITSVFCRAAKRDMRGKWVPKEQITSFLPPHHYCCDEKLSVCGIVEYLEELKAAQAKQDKIPKVKFV